MEDHTGIGRTRSATSELVYRIRARIREQELLPGEKLGSERALADSLGVSRSDLRNALTVLESDHEIIRKSGVPEASSYRTDVWNAISTRWNHCRRSREDKACAFSSKYCSGDCPGFVFRRAFCAICRASNPMILRPFTRFAVYRKIGRFSLERSHFAGISVFLCFLTRDLTTPFYTMFRT